MNVVISRIDQLRVSMSAEFVDARPDGLMDHMPAGSLHWHITLTRDGEAMSFYWTQGPALFGVPKIQDVIEALVMDWIGPEIEFEEWCEELGYDPDSRKAEKIFRAVAAQSLDFSRVFDGLSIEEIDDYINIEESIV